MRDLARYSSWRDYWLISAVTVIVLLVAGAIRGGPLLSETAIVSLPIALGLAAGFLSFVRRHFNSDGPPQ